MLQRIQSLFLMLTAIALGVFLATNFWTGDQTGNTILLNPYHIVQNQNGLAAYQKEIFYVAVIAAIAIGISIFAIFQYKNRVRQMLFVALNSMLIAVAVGVSVYHVKYDAMPLNGGEVGHFDIGTYAGFVALACNWIANRFIRKDEKMVRSADRMR
ncbi:DUF4293 domain-containing protein [Marinilongibacter aquaticus]|uniref:DUF4293 domain-containing protein n=1 Tax=Marinilongibacter aquaticus TaxID=2975157 RepID=UPI0021BDE72E|nr:DUF4293 domain-containing protein [Marinilongibacter aquaticus]UBM57410.1 DUF4293 domain-containing protein [Marinilongibacter aquaticus]